LIDYENNNQFRIYHPSSEKVHIARDVVIDEFSEFATPIDQVWTDEDDEFLNPNEDDEPIQPAQILASKRGQTYQLPQTPRFLDSVGDLPQGQDSMGGFDDAFIEEDIDTPEPPEHFIESPIPDLSVQNRQHIEELRQRRRLLSLPPRRSVRERRSRQLHEGMIAYDTRKKIPMRNLNDQIVDDSSDDAPVANFTYQKIFNPKCYVHMIKILATLRSEKGTAESDESSTLNKARKRPDWPL
jgi:hypothetical protein